MQDTDARLIHPAKLAGEIHPPSSKSISHRALIIAGFSQKGSSVNNVLESEDVQATLRGLQKFGADFEKIDSGYKVLQTASQGGEFINCLNSGTTLRLLTGIATLFSEKTTFSGDESLQTRPMQPLINSLEQLGAKLISDGGTAPLSVEEPISDVLKQCTISGETSSQFISSLLMMSALRDGISTLIELTPPVVSKPYIDLTLQMLKEQGIAINQQQTSYLVSGEANFGLVDIEIPSDMSSAAFFIVAGVLPGNRIIVRNISDRYPQADAAIVKFVQMAGGVVEKKGESILVSHQQIDAFEADLSDSPDIFPILCVLAACASGTSRLFNAKHLRYKETDRISTMVSNLKKVGISVVEQEDGAIITGGPIKGGVRLNSYGDHRIAMACAILGTQADEAIEILDPDCVSVSYPNFYIDLTRISKE